MVKIQLSIGLVPESTIAIEELDNHFKSILSTS